MIDRRSLLGAAGAALALRSGIGPALAQSPIVDGPVHLVVPRAAGGSVDIAARTIATKVEENGGPRFVIENRPGGGGVVAAMAVKDMPPDGRTLFMADSANFIINRAMAERYPFDPATAFKPITTLFSIPLMLVVPASLKVNSVPELLALAKSKPGGLSYASAGVGTGAHLLGAMLADAAKTPMLHVAYKGASQGVIDLVAGRVDLSFIGMLPIKPHVDAGLLKVLAITTKARLPSLPDLPTMAEFGFPAVNSDFIWFGVAAPAATPDGMVSAFSTAFARAVAHKDVQDKLDIQGIVLESSTPSDFAARIRTDYEQFAPMVKASVAPR